MAAWFQVVTGRIVLLAALVAALVALGERGFSAEDPQSKLGFQLEDKVEKIDLGLEPGAEASSTVVEKKPAAETPAPELAPAPDAAAAKKQSRQERQQKEVEPELEFAAPVRKPAAGPAKNQESKAKSKNADKSADKSEAKPEVNAAETAAEKTAKPVDLKVGEEAGAETAPQGVVAGPGDEFGPSVPLAATPDGEGQEQIAPKEKLNVRDAAKMLNYAEWLEEDSPEKAFEQYTLLLSRNPEAADAGRAYFGRARCHYRLGRHLAAFADVEKSFPDHPVEADVRERCAFEFKLGQELMALKDGHPGDVPQGEKKENGYEAASRVFHAVVYNDPEGEFAPSALLNEGRCNDALGKSGAAAEAFAQLSKRYPRSGLRDLALILSARSALASVSGAAKAKSKAKDDELDREDIEEARKKLDSVRLSPAAKTPEGELALKEADQRLEEALARDLLKQADFFLKRRTRRTVDSAEFVLKDILRKYPGTAAAAEAREKLARLGSGPEEEEAK